MPAVFLESSVFTNKKASYVQTQFGKQPDLCRAQGYMRFHALLFLLTNPAKRIRGLNDSLTGTFATQAKEETRQFGHLPQGGIGPLPDACNAGRGPKKDVFLAHAPARALDIVSACCNRPRPTPPRCENCLAQALAIPAMGSISTNFYCDIFALFLLCDPSFYGSVKVGCRA